MSINLYDKALTNKLQSWIVDKNLKILKPEESTRFFQNTLDTNNDKPLSLPLIALSRDKNIDILETTKQPKTFDGFALIKNNKQTITLNAIPIKLSYQIDIYTRYMEDAVEYLRNFTFNLINHPRVDIEIPYNNINFIHRSKIDLEPTITDNSDIKEHLISDQFTRFTIRFGIQDAYLFGAPVINNSELVGIEIDVQDRTDKDIVEIINIKKNT